MLLRQVLFILVLISVKSFSQNYDSIHFENILKTTPAKDLFLKKIIAKDKIIYNDENDQNIKYNASEALDKYKSTRYASQIDLKIKKNDKLIKIGKGFGIDLYTESEKVFTYDILNFNHFILFSNNKNQIIAYKLFNSNEKESTIEKFIEQYSKLYKNDVISNDGEKQYYFYMNDRTVKLIVNKDTGVSS
ncbi:hypothetical protein AB4Y90_09655, partial [Chryseobacterium sp. 2TAF14]|uniref:hypothetical protein n=1 Tax=Chryseobacterium sp. 2TAF14 TaxID=3233007 RepID=UPI003F91896B